MVRRYAFTLLSLMLLISLGIGGCAKRSRGGGAYVPEELLPMFVLEDAKGKAVRPVELTRYSTQELYGRLSPSGNLLAYAGNQKGDFDIWLRDLSTGSIEQITEHSAADGMPAWSPDGETLVFVSMRDDVKGDLYLWRGGGEAVDSDDDQLTARTYADLYPVFSPEGRFIYYVQADETRSRIVRLDLKRIDEKKNKYDDIAQTPITDWNRYNASHPAISPDGSRLAFTIFREGRQAQIAVMNVQYPFEEMDQEKFFEKIRDLDEEKTPIRYGKVRNATTGGYPCGFPAFGPEGEKLYFTRFHKGAPGRYLDANAEGSLWSIPTAGLGKRTPKDVMQTAKQLTPDSGVNVFVQAHLAGLVFSTGRGEDFDVWLIPPEGILSHAADAKSQAEQAEFFDDDYGRVYALEALTAFPADDTVMKGLYEAAQLYEKLGEFEKQQDVLTALIDKPETKGFYKDAAFADRAVSPAFAIRARTVETGVRLQPDDVHQAETRLDAVISLLATEKGKGYHLLRQGDLKRLLAEPAEARRLYRKAYEEFSDPWVKEKAYIRLGALHEIFPDRNPLAEYYLAVFDRWPGQNDLHREAVDALLEANAENTSTDEQLERLSAWIDRHGNKPVFVAKALLKRSELFEAEGRIEAAATAAASVFERNPDLDPEASVAAMKAGDYAIDLAETLRGEGRYNESNSYYARALDAYERLIKNYPARHPRHKRAKTRFLKLSLELAYQAERDGDHARAYKLYGRLIDVEPDMLQALRKRITTDLFRDLPQPPEAGADEAALKRYADDFETRREENWKALVEQWEQALQEEPDRAFVHYCLGYLYTYRPDLSKGDLNKAEAYLQRAKDLDAANPFPIMTLGWIYEMRERLFGDVSDSWIPLAIDAYETAYKLNDRNFDRQTEADLLLNRAMAYSALGNGWNIAYDLFVQRRNLGVPWLNADRELMMWRGFGQAAYQIDRFDESISHYERALSIARRRVGEETSLKTLAYKALEAELIARMALVYHAAGDYATSTNYFGQAIESYRDAGKNYWLGPLTRSIAYNYILQGDYRKAVVKIREAEGFVEEYGVPPSPDVSRIALNPNSSLAPNGFDREGEHYVQISMREMVLRRNHATWYAVEEARLKLENREKNWKRADDSSKPDAVREVFTVANRLGLDELDLGHREQFEEFVDFVYEEALELQWDATMPTGTEFQGNPDDFGVMAANVTNAAERLLKDLDRGIWVEPEELERQALRIRQMARWRYDTEWRQGGNLFVNEENRLKFLNAAALLQLAYGRALATEKEPDSPFTLSGKVDAWLVQVGCFSDAVGLLLEAVRRTAPEIEGIVLPTPDFREAGEIARQRWHLQALVNLAEVASYFTAPGEISDDRGMDYLRQAEALCHPPAPEEIEEEPVEPPRQLDLGEMCWIVDMEIAARTVDGERAERIIDEYVSTWPALLGSTYLQRSATVREALFGRAREIARAAKRYRRVFELAELEDRKMVADELAAFGFRSPFAPLQQAFDYLNQWVSYYDRAAANQSLEDGFEAQHEQAVEAMQKARSPEVWKEIRQRIERQSPEAHNLLFPQAFPAETIVEALGDQAAVVSAVRAGDELWFFVLANAGGDLKVLPTRAGLGFFEAARQAALGRENVASFVQNLKLGKLRQRLEGKTLVYFDLSRLSPYVAAEAFASMVAPADAQALFLTGAQELADAYRARNVYDSNRLLLASYREESSVISEETTETLEQSLPGWDILRDTASQGENAAFSLQQAGVQIWLNPLHVEPGAVANVSLSLGGEVPGLKDLRFAHLLGERFKTRLVVAAAADPADRNRNRLLMLCRYLHALGVPSLVFVPTSAFYESDLESWLADFAGKLDKTAAAESFFATVPPEAELELVTGPFKDDEGRGVDRFDRPRFFGYEGATPGKAGKGLATNAANLLAEGKRERTEGCDRCAVASLETALELQNGGSKAQTVEILRLLASSYERLADWDNAIRIGRKLVESGDPEDEDVLAIRTRLPRWLASAGKLEEAQRENAEVENILRQRLKNVRGAKKRSTQLLLTQTFSVRGELQRKNGDFEKAIGTFSQGGQWISGLSDGNDALKASASGMFAEAASTALDSLDDRVRARNLLEISRENLPGLDRAAYLELEKKHTELAEQMRQAGEGSASRRLAAQLKTLETQLGPLQEAALAHARTEAVEASLRLATGDASCAARMAGRSRELAEFAGDFQLARRAETLQTEAWIESGNWNETLEELESRLSLAGEDASRRASLLTLRGRALAATGRFDKALESLEKARKLALTHDLESLRVEILHRIGQTHIARNRPVEALGAFRRAVVAARLLGDRRAEVENILYVSEALALDNRPKEALLTVRAGREANRAFHSQTLDLKLDVAEGRLLLTLGKASQAAERFEKSIQINDLAAHPTLHREALYRLGEAEYKRKNAQAAEKHWRKAMEIVERQPSRLAGGVSSVPSLDARPSDMYDALVRLFWEQKRTEEAFDLSERRRARGFLNLLGTDNLSFALESQRAAAESYREALGKLREAEIAAATSPAAEQSRFDILRDDARERVRTLRASLAAQGVELPSYLSVDSLPYRELAASLPSFAPVVSYCLLDERLLIFVLKGEDLKAVEVSVTRQELERSVKEFRRKMETFSPVETLAQKLYSWLVKPVKEAFGEEVLIVPDGPLHFLPFAALWDGEKWLAQNSRIANLPSVNYVRFLSPAGSGASMPMAFQWSGMGSDTLPPATTRHYARRLLEWRELAREWPDLPFTGKETESFGETFRAAKLFSGTDASRVNFLNEASRAGLLHVATHAVYDETAPMLSYLQFGGRQESELFPRFDTQRVTWFDILGLRLKARVVTLSACETGLGDPAGGANILGLHRAFLTAGAGTVISSLWRISDLSSGVLMKNFHRNLAKGESPGLALHNAQKRVMRYWPHPAHWAGFRLEGLGR